MPFKSDAQRKYLFAKHPKVAHEWAEKYGVPKGLPEHVTQAKTVRRDTLPRKSRRGR